MERIVYTIEAKTKTALHIGSASSATNVSDGLLRRTVLGELMIPGTSLAGALRGYLTRIAPALTRLANDQRICHALQPRSNATVKACGCVICHLMGDVKPPQHDHASGQ